MCTKVVGLSIIACFTAILTWTGAAFGLDGDDEGQCGRLLSPLTSNTDVIDSKIRDYFHDRTGGFGRGDSALDHHFPILLEMVEGSSFKLAEAVVRSLKWTANEIVGGGTSNWFMRNHYQIGYEGWVKSAQMMLDRILEESDSDSEQKNKVIEMIEYIESELSSKRVVDLRYGRTND